LQNILQATVAKSKSTSSMYVSTAATTTTAFGTRT